LSIYSTTSRGKTKKKKEAPERAIGKERNGRKSLYTEKGIEVRHTITTQKWGLVKRTAKQREVGQRNLIKLLNTLVKRGDGGKSPLDERCRKKTLKRREKRDSSTWRLGRNPTV